MSPISYSIPVISQFLVFKARHNVSLDSASIKAFLAAWSAFTCFANMSAWETSSMAVGQLTRFDGKLALFPKYKLLWAKAITTL